jgi:hypothetical protein
MEERKGNGESIQKRREVEEGEDALSFDNLRIKEVNSEEELIGNGVHIRVSPEKEDSESGDSMDQRKQDQMHEMIKLQNEEIQMKLKKTSNLGTRNTSFRNTDLSMRRKIDKNVNISGIKKNFSYDITREVKTEHLEVGLSDEKEKRRRVRKLSQEILELNRMEVKESLKTKKSDFDARGLRNIDLSSNISKDELSQKLIRVNSSFKSNNHKDFLVKINMIGDLKSGKTEFVSIVTDSKQPSRNKKEAKKGMQGMNQKLNKKE